MDDLSTSCMYCNKKKSEVKWLRPVYAWRTGKLEGYWCDKHYEQVLE